MKTILYLNWILLGLYALYCIYALATINSSGLDPAGKGMSSAFSMIALALVVVFMLLNLINVDWLRVVIFALCLLPLFLALKHFLKMQAIDKGRVTGSTVANYFHDPHLKKMAKAIHWSKLNEMETLLTEDASNINQVGEDGMTLVNLAIHKAATHYISSREDSEAYQIVELLLGKGADPNLGAQNAALMSEVVLPASPQLLKLLLEAGVDPNGKNQYGVAAIHHLVQDNYNDHHEKMKLLMEYNADPNLAFGDEGWMLNYNALIFAVSKKQWNNCLLLLDHGADPNFKPAYSDLDFWSYYYLSLKEYQEAKETPESFQKLMNHPRIVEERKD